MVSTINIILFMNIEKFTNTYNKLLEIISSEEFAKSSKIMKLQILSAKRVLDVLGNLFNYQERVCLSTLAIDFDSEQVVLILNAQDTSDLLAIASWYIVIYEDDKIPLDEKNTLKKILSIAFISPNPERVNEFHEDISLEQSIEIEDELVDDPEIGDRFWDKVESFDVFLDSEFVLISSYEKIKIGVLTGRQAIQQYLDLRNSSNDKTPTVT